MAVTRVFLVIQEGRYRHDIRGVYTCVVEAMRAARRAAREDCDGYHEYTVWETALGEYVDDVKRVRNAPAVRRGCAPGSILEEPWVAQAYDVDDLSDVEATPEQLAASREDRPSWWAGS